MLLCGYVTSVNQDQIEINKTLSYSQKVSQVDQIVFETLQIVLFLGKNSICFIKLVRIIIFYLNF